MQPVWLETDHGKVTPGQIREQLESNVAAVAVSLVDFRTGYLCDIEGIRQVIGDRLLIVDAIQGFGVVDAAVRGRRRRAARAARSGAAPDGAPGIMALSASARSSASRRCFSGFTGTEERRAVGRGAAARSRRPRLPGVRTPTRSPRRASRPRCEDIAAVGVPAINAAVAERVSQVIELADEFAIPVVTLPRRAGARRHRRARAAGRAGHLLAASLHNHGVTATTRSGQVRLSVHAATSDETLDMLRGAFVSYGTAASY